MWQSQAENIQYLGFVTDQEKLRLLQDAHAVIHPSPLESLSMITLEAIWAKKPFFNGACQVLNYYSEQTNTVYSYQDQSFNRKLREICITDWDNSRKFDWKIQRTGSKSDIAGRPSYKPSKKYLQLDELGFESDRILRVIDQTRAASRKQKPPSPNSAFRRRPWIFSSNSVTSKIPLPLPRDPGITIPGIQPQVEEDCRLGQVPIRPLDTLDDILEIHLYSGQTTRQPRKLRFY